MTKEVPVGDYFITKKIGKGSFSNVYKAYHKDSKLVFALKIIDIVNFSPKLLESLDNEIKILINIDHPNIVKLHETVRSKNYIYLVLDYCENGDLHQYIKKNKNLDEKIVKDFFTQASKGLYFLWSNNLIHRDLKPHNLLLTIDNVIKIADFGFARYIEEAKLLDTLCGSPIYMAPEILKNREYNSKVDLWSMGIILYELLTSKPPFTGKNHVELLNNILSTKFIMPDNSSKNCSNLLTSLLNVNPNYRIEFFKFFEHPYFEGYDFSQKPKKNINITEDYITGEVPFILVKELATREPDIKTDPENVPEIYKMDDKITVDNYILITKKNKNTYLNNSTNKLIESIVSIQIYIKSIYNSTTEIAFYGDTQEKAGLIIESLVLYVKALHMYEHAIDVCNKSFASVKESQNFLQPIYKLLIEKFTYILLKAENIYKIILENKNQYKIIFPNVEKLIYYHALDKTREATSYEVLEKNNDSLYLYTISVRLFESLTMDKNPLDKSDTVVIENFILKITQRIRFLMKI